MLILHAPFYFGIAIRLLSGYSSCKEADGLESLIGLAPLPKLAPTLPAPLGLPLLFKGVRKNFARD